MSNRAFDGFEDVINGNAGIYGADTPGMANALGNHDRREVSPTQEGLQISFVHDACGTGIVATVEWPDIVALAHGIAPKLAYATRLNGQQPSLVERYPAFAANLGDWAQRTPGGPWALQNVGCINYACPTRKNVPILLLPEEAVEAYRVASSQRWIRDEAALQKWVSTAAQMHAQAGVRR